MCRSLMTEVEGREDAVKRLAAELQDERERVWRRGEELERAERALAGREEVLRAREEALQSRGDDLVQLADRRTQGLEQLLLQQASFSFIPL